MTEEELYQYISDYIKGSLSEKEKKTFRLKLNEDAEFCKEYELHKSIQEKLSKHDNVIKLKETVQDVLKESKSVKTKKKNKLIWITLAILFTILILWLIFKNDSNGSVQSSDELYAAYYEKYPPYTIFRNQGDSTLLRHGLSAYAEGDYERAIPILTQLSAETKTGTAHFYLAMSYVENEQYDLAGPILAELSKGTNVEFNQPVMWHRALLYVRHNKMDSARMILNTLEETSGKYGRLSAELLDKIQ